MKKKIKLPNGLICSICFLNNRCFLVIKLNNSNNSNYLPIPECISIVKDDEYLLVQSEDLTIFSTFQINLIKFLKNIFSGFKKTIVLKGLGLKVTRIENYLEFKLGFSHLIKVDIPDSIKSVLLNKNNITIEGFNSVDVGNFLNRIRNLRCPNIYKGKGIWYKNEVIILKTIKKK